MIDLQLLASEYMYEDIPREKQYLAHYFKSPIERRFLAYWLVFSCLYERGKNFIPFYQNFINHTGYYILDRLLRTFIRRMLLIDEELEKANKDFDLEKIGLIKSGSFKF